MSFILRYGWDEREPYMHPQERLKADGMKAIRSEPVPIADCWFFEVEKLVDPLPSCYDLTPNYKFTDARN